MEGEWPLVGRTAELERVGKLLRARAGGVVLAGPAGMGKTRLAGECLALAAQLGFAPLRVSATQAASSLPFGAFAPLLQELTGGANRADLLRQVTKAVMAHGEGKPLAVLVDDAHLLDEGSAALTHQLAASKETFVVATVRTGEPASDAVIALWKDGLAERLEVPPLTIDQVEAVLGAVLGAPADGATVRLLWARSDGNVLFLKEVVLAALAAGVLRGDEGLWRLAGHLPASDRLVELVEARLSGLGDAERAGLSLVAVGEPLGVDVFTSVVGRGQLDALEARALVRVEADRHRLQIRLGHPLYGDVLRARLSPLRARDLSRVLADAIEGTGARRREDILRVASWRLDGGSDVQPDLLVAAGRQARALFEFELAERLVRAGIAAGAGFEAGLFLAELLFLQGRYGDAEAFLVALAPRAASDRDRARVALIRIDSLSWASRMAEAMVVLQEAEASITEAAWLDELTVKRTLFAVFGQRVVLGGRRVGGTAVAVELVEPLLGRLRGQALVEACYVAGVALAASGRTADAIAASERGLAAHRDLVASHMLWYPSISLVPKGLALIWAGRLAEAEALAARCYEEALADEALEPGRWFAGMLGDCHRAQGRAATGCRLAQEAVGFLRPLGRVYFPYFLNALAESLVVAGRIDDAETIVAENDALPGGGLLAEESIRIKGWAAVARGDQALAKQLLGKAAALAARSGNRVFESAALHDLARLGHAPEVVRRLRELAAMIEGPLAPIRAAHAEALVAKDPLGLEAASIAFEQMPAYLLAAEAAADAAVAWRKAGDPRKAAASERRAHMLADRCEGARTPALTAVTARAALSARELEIARLAAAGVPNKEIGERLFLSRHTVQNKLHAAYEKLGVDGRADLAQALEGY